MLWLVFQSGFFVICYNVSTLIVSGTVRGKYSRSASAVATQ